MAGGSAERTETSCGGKVGRAVAVGSVSSGKPPAGAEALNGLPAASQPLFPQLFVSCEQRQGEDLNITFSTMCNLKKYA